MIVRGGQDPHLAIDSPSRTLAAVRTPKVVTYSPREVPRLREQTRRMWNSDIGHAFAKIDLDRSHDDGPSGGIAALRGEMASLSREQADELRARNFIPEKEPNSPRGPSSRDDGWGTQTPEEYVQSQDTLLRTAELYWVSRDMTTVLRHYADTAPVTTLEGNLIPHESGFVVFEEAIPGVDSDNKDNDYLRIAAFGWGVVYIKGMKALHMEFYDRTARLFTPVERQLRREDGLGEFYFLGASAWEQGVASDDFTGFYASATDQAKTSFFEDRRLTLAFFMLIQERIAAVNVRSPDRAQRRQAAREGLVSPLDVRIVTLRERYTKSTAAGTREVDWKFRWPSRGHKRHIVGKDGSVREINVRGCIKGPKDKPLKIVPTVNAVRR